MDYARFVEDNTTIGTPPLVPEIRLHMADEVIPLWRKIETETGITNPPPPYWAFAWAGGQALARYILDHPEIVAGKTVLDFGAGSGLIGLAAAQAGAASVLCADIDPFADAATAQNGTLNGLTTRTTDDNVIGQTGWQVILVGDMCYERPLAERLTQWLRSEVAKGVFVLIGDPGRNYFPKNGVEKLQEYTVPTPRDLEDRDVRQTGIFRLLHA